MENNELNYEIRPYPLNNHIVGNFTDNEVTGIFIKKNILLEIDEYLSIDISRESGGVLTGNVYKNESEELFVVIDNFIIAKNTKSNLTKLTFTPETWDCINREKEKYYSDKIILGWFHSHPGHKVFLSSYDMFIQENFFSNKYNIAYVHDPVNKESGFFAWKEDKIVKADYYYIIDDNLFDIGKPDGKESFQEKKIIKPGNSPENLKFAVIIFLLIINIIISLLTVLDRSEIKNGLETMNEEYNSVKAIKNDVEKIGFKLNEILLNQISNMDSNLIIKNK